MTFRTDLDFDQALSHFGKKISLTHEAVTIMFCYFFLSLIPTVYCDAACFCISLYSCYIKAYKALISTRIDHVSNMRHHETQVS